MDALVATLATVAAVGMATAATGIARPPTKTKSAPSSSGMNGSYNRSDFDAFASHLCTALLQSDGFEAGWREEQAGRRTHSHHRQLGRSHG